MTGTPAIRARHVAAAVGVAGAFVLALNSTPDRAVPQRPAPTVPVHGFVVPASGTCAQWAALPQSDRLVWAGTLWWEATGGSQGLRPTAQDRAATASAVSLGCRDPRADVRRVAAGSALLRETLP